MCDPLRLGFILCICLYGCEATCDESGIGICQRTSGIEDFLMSEGIETTSQYAYESTWLFMFDRSQLSEYCEYFDMYTKCFKDDVMTNCTTEMRFTMTGVNESINFLCKDSLEEYLVNQACMKQRAVIESFTDCYDNVMSRIREAINRKESCIKTDVEKLCKLDVINMECGLEARNWTAQFLTKITGPALKEFGCSNKIHKSKKKKSAKIDKKLVLEIIFGALIISLLIIALYVTIVCMKRLKRQRNSLTSRTHRNAQASLGNYQSHDRPPRRITKEQELSLLDEINNATPV